MVLDSLDQSYSFFKSKLLGASSEELWIAALDANFRVISATMLFKGTVNYCLFHPRDIFRFAIIHNAVFFIIAHNHPSNVSLPSYDDIQNTKKLFNLSELMEITFLDHLIITEDSYYSFKREKLFLKWLRQKPKTQI